MKVVYDETDKIYKENGLTDLPWILCAINNILNVSLSL
jgi:hypothetical protein